MCGVCGCGGEEGHHHEHDRAPQHAHAHGLSATRMVRVEQDIMAANQAHADANRRYFAQRGILVLNLVSSPGAGKTSLLVRTLAALKGECPLAVIEGDQQTGLDAARIAATGVPAYQINTGKGCHLEAHGIAHALAHLPGLDGGILFIENVGNLVCPAGFDLGEAHKVVVLSTTEGEDKPLKYPDMFHAADLMLLNKADLLPYVDFSVGNATDYARRVHPGITSITLSANNGEGMAAWLAWLRAAAASARAMA